MPHIKARTGHGTPSWGRTGECPKRGDWGGNRIQEIGKLRGDFSSTVLLRSCPNKDSIAPVIWLNSTSLSPNSFLKTNIPLTFSTGKTHQTEFYITKLDKGYSVVLGYDWLVHHNPSIDWAETKVVFLGAMKVPGGPSTPVSPKFNIQFVTAKKISHLCHKPGNSIYCLEHHSIA